MVKEKTKNENLKKEHISPQKDLILHNDDFNTFDFVIETLIDVCKHEPEQAQQCTLIVHYKGKCAIKSGVFSELKPIYDSLISRGLTATIN